MKNGTIFSSTNNDKVTYHSKLVDEFSIKSGVKKFPNDWTWERIISNLVIICSVMLGCHCPWQCGEDIQT